jgi:hypothetical protein
VPVRRSAGRASELQTNPVCLAAGVLHELQLLRLEQATVQQRVVERGDVGHAGDEPPACQGGPSGEGCAGDVDRVVRCGHERGHQVATDVVVAFLLGHEEAGAGETEGLEQPALQFVLVGAAGHRLDDRPERDVPDVGVTEVGAWRRGRARHGPLEALRFRSGGTRLGQDLGHQLVDRAITDEQAAGSSSRSGWCCCCSARCSSAFHPYMSRKASPVATRPIQPALAQWKTGTPPPTSTV